LDIGVLGYIGIVQHKEHSPEVLSVPPGTPCIRKIVGAAKWCQPIGLKQVFGWKGSVVDSVAGERRSVIEGILTGVTVRYRRTPT